MPWRSAASAAPKRQRIHVEVLAIQADALLGQQTVDVFDQPLARGRQAEVQQPHAVFFGQGVAIVADERLGVGHCARRQIAVAPRSRRIVGRPELLGRVVQIARGSGQRDFQARGIADVRAVAPTDDEVERVAFGQLDLLVACSGAAAPFGADRPVEHRLAAMQHVDVGGRAPVDRQERRPHGVPTGLRGGEADDAILALGARMTGQPARLPADFGHRAGFRRRVVGDARIAAAELGRRPRAQAGHRIFAARRRPQEPLGMILVEPRAGHDPFRLEPEQGLQSLGVRMIADRRRPRGNRLGSTSQVPTCGQPCCWMYQPASIHQ